MLHGEVDEALKRFWTDTRERHRFLQHDRERPILPPEDLFLKPEDFFALTQRRMRRWRVRGNETGRLGRGRCPTCSVDRGAPEPLKRLQLHVGARPHRVLIVAESEGRRESLLELLRDSKIEPPSVATLAEFEAGDEQFAIAVAPLAEGFFWFEPEASTAIQFVTETELFATAPTARRRRKQEQVSNVDALIKDLSELKVGDPVVHVEPRHRPLRRADQHRPRRRRQRVPAPRIRRQGDALRAGRAAAPDQPLHRRRRRRGAAAQARLAASGTRPSARPPSRCATPPPSC